MAEPQRPSDNALLLDAAIESIPYGFCIWSSEFRLVMWNRHYLDIYGFSPKSISKGMPLDELVELSSALGNHPHQPAREFAAAYRQELSNNRFGARAKSRELVAGGRWIETAHVFSAGLGWVVTHEDVTDALASSELVQKRSRELELQNMRFDATINTISQGLCMYDARGRLVICNAPYARIYRLPERLIAPGTPLDDILNYLLDQGMRAGVDRNDYIRERHELIASGQYGKNVHEVHGRTVLMQHHPMQDGGWVSTHEDITEQRQREARIEHLAGHDPLTELPNRARFLTELTALESAIGRGARAAVLHIDLDHFTAVNDQYGNAVGDKVLKQAAARLIGTTRGTDVLARLGADEFALLLRPILRPADAAAIADRIVKAMEVPFAVGGRQVSIGASIGIAMAPQDGETADALMTNAGMAVLRAKDEGRATFHFFERGMDETMRRRRDLELGLRRALDRSELRIEFQPIVSTSDDRITCLEALLRWDNAEGGEIAPDEFIPVAEETGLIVGIGEWVLREACRAAARWPTSARVAVNLSPAQFTRGGLYDTVTAALADSGLPAARLELEITESLLLADDEPTLKTLHRLHELGVHFAMDDFGTGYSSLSYLRSFPFDKIKMDRSFMRDVGSGPESLAVVKAIIGLGHSLGMSVTAEGVETEAQFEAVRAQGCDEAQGYYFSVPLRPEAAAGLLSAQLRQAGTKPRGVD